MKYHFISFINFTLVLHWFNAFTGSSAEIIGTTNTDLLVELYKLNPTNIESIGQNLTDLVRWVTTTRPFALPGPRLNPNGYSSTPPSHAIGRIYLKVKALIADLQDPNLWSNEDKLLNYGFDQQSVMTASITTPEYFEDMIAAAQDYFDDLRDIIWWNFEVSPDFYKLSVPRDTKPKVMAVWEVIHDMVVYIVTSRAGGIRVSQKGPLMAYLMNLREEATPEGESQRFSFNPVDLLTFEIGLKNITNAIDTFTSDRNWDSIDRSYMRLRDEFSGGAPFLKTLEKEHEVLRKFIHDYFLLFWRLMKKIYIMRQDIYKWAETFNGEIQWTDTENSELSIFADIGGQ
ncbi:hypothetical protein TWF102_003898 [Orbilia oligospora]|uniref:Uncharacterized protein n=1 Tax=Orbilia oligospora TaxID=2813651 RepID=A0A7C8NCE2_ORBOL|nr:hypothetical protein TWF102_003898 [Orbilia oligospora]KAF3118280.1 hypothetical protein TWF103_000294 [Orbilia oligospora]